MISRISMEIEETSGDLKKYGSLVDSTATANELARWASNTVRMYFEDEDK